MEIPIKHLEPCQVCYGYAYTWGWCGIGGIYYDPKGPAIWFDDDKSIMSEDEIIYNDFMRMNILEFMGEL